jgi:predicted exporter
VLLILFAVYRSPLPVVLSALPAISGLLVGVAAVSVWFGPVHGITLAFGAILIGEAVDYPTYLYAHAAQGEALEQTLARIGLTLGLAVLTTACGAIAMLLSSFRGLAQLGLLTLVGVGTSGLVTRFVLPALTPARTLGNKLVRVPFASGGSAWISAPLWLVLAPALLAAGVLAAKADRIWDDDLANLSPLPAELKALDRELRAQLGAPDVRHLVVIAAADREQALQKSEATIALLEQAVGEGWIERYDIAARYLPSAKMQALRKAALPDPQTLAANLEQAMRGLPFRQDLFAPFLADVEKARNAAPIDQDAWRGTALAARLERLLAPAPQGKGWIALAPISGVRNGPALDRAIRASGDADVFVLDLKREADALVAGYRLESLRLFALGVLCIALVVYAGLRSVAQTLRVLIPVLVAAALDVATLVALGTGLTVVHLVALLLVIGVGLNYGLFFNRRRNHLAEDSLTRLALVVASLATLCAALALTACDTPVLRAIGATIAIGTVYAFVLAAIFARVP